MIATARIMRKSIISFNKMLHECETELELTESERKEFEKRFVKSAYVSYPLIFQIAAYHWNTTYGKRYMAKADLEQEPDGQTALIVALWGENVGAALALIESKADVHAMAKYSKRSCLEIAAAHTPGAVRALLAAGAYWSASLCFGRKMDRATAELLVNSHNDLIQSLCLHLSTHFIPPIVRLVLSFLFLNP